MLNNVNKILFIRLRFIGDCLLTTPAIRALRKNFPKARISYLAESESAKVLTSNQHIDELLVLNKELANEIKLIKTIRKDKFDVVFDFFGNPRSALITYLSGAKHRIGFDYRGRRYCYTKIIKNSSNVIPDAIDVYLNALASVDILPHGRKLELPINEDSLIKAKTFLKENVIGSKSLVGIFPGASWQAKRWHKERFAELADRIIENLQADILIFEGPKENGLAREIAKAMKHKATIVTNVSLQELSAMLSLCKVFISNDAAPMHVAVAVGTKTIAIFGPGEPQIWFPYTEYGHIAIQRKIDCCRKDICEKNHECMSAITVDEVFGAVCNLFNKKP